MVSIIEVNLQQGFIMNSNTVVAAYSHHNRNVVFKLPFTKNDIVLPDRFSGYYIIEGKTDSFSIQYWTPDGYKSM